GRLSTSTSRSTTSRGWDTAARFSRSSDPAPSRFTNARASGVATTAYWPSFSRISYFGAGLCPVRARAISTCPRADRLHVRPVVTHRLVDVVAAEFLQRRVRQHQRHHRLADHARRRHNADVRALIERGP